MPRTDDSRDEVRRAYLIGMVTGLGISHNGTLGAEGEEFARVCDRIYREHMAGLLTAWSDVVRESTDDLADALTFEADLRGLLGALGVGRDE